MGLGVLAAGAVAVPALATQTAAAPDVVKYETKLTITKEKCCVEGDVVAGAKQCKQKRQVVLYKRRSGADRKLGTDRSNGQGRWEMAKDSLKVHGKVRVYAKVRPKERKRFVCSADRSPNIGSLWDADRSETGG